MRVGVHRARGGAPAGARRREVERLLLDSGLVRGPRQLHASAPAVPGLAERDLAPRLRAVLEALGPVFATFGVYLSRRPDLLPAADCLILAELGTGAPTPAMPAEAVHRALGQALGRPSSEIFVTFDDRPWAVDTRSQSHRARLADGQPVLVRLLRPDMALRLDEDLALLGLLERAFADVPTMDFAAAVSGYRLWLESALDLGVEAARLQALARSAEESDLLAVARVHPQLSTPAVLTVDWLDGIALEAIPDDYGEARRRDVARRLHLLWLEQAVVAGTFPVEARVVVMRDGRLGVVGGELADMPEPARAGLWQYLRSTAAHQLDDACDSLLPELEPVRRGASESDLLLHLRQVVPFRDGSWTERGDTLVEYLVLHWQVARSCGFVPRPHLAAFYQGLFGLARHGQRLAPHADSLREAQEDMRWLAGWMQLRQLTDPRQLGASLEANLASLLELPQKLDQVLDLAVSDQPRLRVRAVEQPAVMRRKNTSTLIVCMGLAMATLLLLATQLERLQLDGPWIERISAAFFLLIAGRILWNARRR